MKASLQVDGDPRRGGETLRQEAERVSTSKSTPMGARQGRAAGVAVTLSDLHSMLRIGPNMSGTTLYRQLLADALERSRLIAGRNKSASPATARLPPQLCLEGVEGSGADPTGGWGGGP